MNKLQQQIAKDYSAVRNEQASGLCGGGICEAIRTAVALNETASVKDFITALPALNPTTIRIQYTKSHKLIAEDDNLLAALKIANNTQAKAVRGFSYLRLRSGAYAVHLNGVHIGSVHRTKEGRWSPVGRFESETTREDAAELLLYHNGVPAKAEPVAAPAPKVERTWGNYRTQDVVEYGHAARNNRAHYTGQKIHRLVSTYIVGIIDVEKEKALTTRTMGHRFLSTGKPVLFSCQPMCGCTQGQHAGQPSPNYTAAGVTCQKCLG